MSEPLVTIAIPAYDRPDLLAETLAGLAALDRPGEWEVLICDDGQTSAARELAAAFPGACCRYQRNEPALGAVGNWNRCLTEARGAWVSVLHEDDGVYPWYLTQVRPLLLPGTAAVCTQTVQGPTPPALAPPSGSPQVWRYPPRYFLKSSMTPFPGVMIRTEIARRLGGFDPRWGPLADYEFWYRLAQAGPVQVVRTPAAFYRVRPGQWTERAWVRMLRLSHLLRLRIAREQFPASPRAGHWLARFFTYRNALAYAARFPERPPGLTRALQLGRIPLASLPSGWIWQGLKLAS